MRSALKLFEEIQAAGFTGDYSRVTEFVRRWRVEGGTAVVNAYVPLKFELGEAFQFDWSEEHLLIGFLQTISVRCADPVSGGVHRFPGL